MINSDYELHIVGGGLAGCEAAWQALSSGCRVIVHEMRPKQRTDAHKTGDLAELVCSNSLKSENPASAPGQLKREMAAMDSLIIAAAMSARVPAGQALAVDRHQFSQAVSQQLKNQPRFERRHHEVMALPTQQEMEAKNQCWIVATGPLTSAKLADALAAACGRERLYFYDAIAPIIAADSIDMSHAYWGSRYGKDSRTLTEGETAEGGDYLNLPLNREQYDGLIAAITSADYVPLHAFEHTRYFESCLPIEVMAERGHETLRYGPLKPVGLIDPSSGERPWAVVQLRRENRDGTMFSMVGFQTKMKWGEQKRVFGMIPALAQAEFLRFGSVHRNTYLPSPLILNDDLSFRENRRLFLAGQIAGVEGYTESAAIGLIAGRAAASRLNGRSYPLPPPGTMIGSLLEYVTKGPLGDYQPMNANLGLLPKLDKRRRETKQDRKARQTANAHQTFLSYHRRLTQAEETALEADA